MSDTELRVRFDPDNQTERCYIVSVVDRLEFTFHPTYVTYIAGKKVVGHVESNDR